MMYYCFYDSPIGRPETALPSPALSGRLSQSESNVTILLGGSSRASGGQQLLLTGTATALTGLFLYEQKHAPKLPADAIRDESPFFAVITQLNEYFNGSRVEFDLPLEPVGTEFQKRVWLELRNIPFGQTQSYGAMAKRIGNPSASRAVGLANGRNPISIIVPCHRVIGANGSLTGYGGGLDAKRWLLQHESRQLALFADNTITAR